MVLFGLSVLILSELEVTYSDVDSEVTVFEKQEPSAAGKALPKDSHFFSGQKEGVAAIKYSCFALPDAHECLI